MPSFGKIASLRFNKSFRDAQTSLQLTEHKAGLGCTVKEQQEITDFSQNLVNLCTIMVPFSTARQQRGVVADHRVRDPLRLGHLQVHLRRRLAGAGRRPSHLR